MSGIEHTQQGQTPLSVARPDGTPRAGVIVVQEAFGVTTHIEDVCERAAGAGYLAVAPHLFHRTGDPALAYDDIAGLRPHMDALTAEGIGADLDACLAFLTGAGIDARHTGITGFCMGGSVTFWAAATYELGAAVTFYGGGLGSARFGFPPLLELGDKFRTPWLGLYGELDQSIPMDEVEELRKRADRAPVDTEIATFPNADHGFHCNDRPAVYNEAAAADAWSRTLAWFARYLS